ncbi:MAG: hypothetical protein AAF747_06310 [Planctomycetota bacterium]
MIGLAGVAFGQVIEPVKKFEPEAQALVDWLNAEALMIPEDERAAPRIQAALDTIREARTESTVSASVKDYPLSDDVLAAIRAQRDALADAYDEIHDGAQQRRLGTIYDLDEIGKVWWLDWPTHAIYIDTLTTRSYFAIRYCYPVLDTELLLAMHDRDADRVLSSLMGMVGLFEQRLGTPSQFATYTRVNVVVVPIGWVLGYESGLLSDEALAMLQARLQRIDVLGLVSRGYSFGKEVQMLGMREAHAEDEAVGGADDWPEPLGRVLVQIERNNEEALEILGSGRLDIDRFREISNDAADAIEGPSGFDRELKQGTPDMGRLMGAWSIESRLRGMVVGLASQRYRLANGRLPTSQAELVEAGLLDEPLESIFTALPLGIAPHGRTGEYPAFMVYDPGPDAEDGGGAGALINRDVFRWIRGEQPLPEGDLVLFSTNAAWIVEHD